MGDSPGIGAEVGPPVLQTHALRAAGGRVPLQRGARGARVRAQLRLARVHERGGVDQGVALVAQLFILYVFICISCKCKLLRR